MLEFLLVFAIAFAAIKIGENYGRPIGYRRAASLLLTGELEEEE